MSLEGLFGHHQLISLDVTSISLRSLSLEFVRLTSLTQLSVEGNNDLIFPPPQAVQKGIPGIRAFLNEQLLSSKQQK